MKRLPPAKRNQLIGVILVTLALISGVYFLLIRPENQGIYKLATDINTHQADLQKMKETIKGAAATVAKFEEMNRQLSHAEEDVASGDVYAWTYDTLRRFKSTYHVDIPNIGQPALGDVDLLPAFPYRQVKITLLGTGYFHDLGKFVSDFENNFPHMRLVNLSVDPMGNSSERLNFRMDVVTLVKPTS